MVDVEATTLLTDETPPRRGFTVQVFIPFTDSHLISYEQNILEDFNKDKKFIEEKRKENSEIFLHI